MKTKDKRNIHIYVTTQEREKLDKYCDTVGQTITAVLRELIRSLPDS